MSNCFNYKNATGSTRKPEDLANISATFCLQGVAEDCNVTESTNYVQYFKNTLAPTYNKVGYKYIKCFKTLKKESPFTNDGAITHTCHFGKEDTDSPTSSYMFWTKTERIAQPRLIAL